MREKLIKYIKKRFGSVCGSHELKEMRGEITLNALERYDEEIKNGADERSAYDTAIGSIGDINELLDSMNIRERRRRRSTVIVSCIFATAYIAVLAAGLMSNGLSGMLAIMMILTLPLGALAFGVISLTAGTRRKALSIVFTAIGGYSLFFSSFMASSTLSLQDHYVFDFTADAENIASIETVTVSKLEYSNGELLEDGLVYEVKGLIAPSEWGTFLSDAAKLDYKYRDISAKELKDELGKEMILIRFREPRYGLSFILIGKNCQCFGETSENGVRIRESGYCSDSKAWKALLSKYAESGR